MPRRRNDDHYDGGSPYGGGKHGIISSFDGEHAFLSNFWEEPFDCGGKTVPTAEHAFQAQKAKGQPTVQALVLSANTPGHAKRLGRRVALPDNWNDVRVEIMRKILACKFAVGSDLAAKLVATHPAELVEGNTWGDTFWGCVRTPEKGNLWVGSNNLGILLMERREHLMRGVTL